MQARTIEIHIEEIGHKFRVHAYDEHASDVTLTKVELQTALGDLFVPTGYSYINEIQYRNIFNHK